MRWLVSKRLARRPCPTVGNMAERKHSLPVYFADANERTAARRLRLNAGRAGVEDWESENGPLTADELADGLTRAKTVLGRPRADPSGG
jgi:hypothetical protein